jgi:hypothetical protein
MTHAEVMDWSDAPVTVRHGMPHRPGNPPLVLQRVLGIGRGDDCNVSHLAAGAIFRPAGLSQPVSAAAAP